jgi:hypothetical protein
VGQIGAGNYFVVGTNFSGVAGSSGVLKLYYWDSNNDDNSGSVAANVSVVPEPDTLALMLAGLGALAVRARRTRVS